MTAAGGNRSAQVSVVALVASLAMMAFAFAHLGSGYGFQVLGLLAAAVAVAGVGLGFVGLTVARSGAPRMALAVTAMVANALVVLGLLVLAASRA